MYTYSQLLEEGFDEIGDHSARAERMLTKGINEALTMYRSILRQYWTEETRNFTIQKNQTRYQLPEAAIRAAELVVFVDNIKYTVTPIFDDEEWDIRTAHKTSNNIPTMFRLVGKDEFEIYPVPSTTYEGGGKIKFQAKGKPLSVKDFDTGTVSITNGENEIEHSASGFTQQMVGRTLLIPEDTSETNGYKIIEFINSSRVKIENAYAGATDATASFIIGEVPNIPGEFHLSLLDRGIFRYFRSRKDLNTAGTYKESFNEAVALAKEVYSSPDMSTVVPSKKYRTQTRGLNTLKGKAGAIDG